MAGLWFEEFTDGMVFNHEWSRTITETDNVWFSLLTMNVQPLHIDAHYAAKSEWGKPLVNSLFTLGLLIGMIVNDTTLNTTLANLGMTDVRFPKPLFQGDSVKVRTIVRSKRESKSRPNEGIVNFYPRDDQPERRCRRDLRARGADAQAAQIGPGADALAAVRSRQLGEDDRQGGGERRRRHHPRSRGCGASRRQDGGAQGRRRDARQARAPVPRRYVRVNSLDTAWCREDVEAVIPAGPDGIVLPKSFGPEDVARLERVDRTL